MARGQSQVEGRGEHGGPLLATVKEEESRGTNSAWSMGAPLLCRALCRLPSSWRGSRSCAQLLLGGCPLPGPSAR